MERNDLCATRRASVVTCKFGGSVLDRKMDCVKKCVLCFETITDDPHGHNPEPLARMKDGVCCSKCNTSRVLPARFNLLNNSQNNASSQEASQDSTQKSQSSVECEGCEKHPLMPPLICKMMLGYRGWGDMLYDGVI